MFIFEDKDGIDISHLASRVECEATYLKANGDTLKGNLNMNGHRITNLPVPTEGHEIANKHYLDSLRGYLLRAIPFSTVLSLHAPANETVMKRITFNNINVGILHDDEQIQVLIIEPDRSRYTYGITWSLVGRFGEAFTLKVTLDMIYKSAGETLDILGLIYIFDRAFTQTNDPNMIVSTGTGGAVTRSALGDELDTQA